MAGIRFCPPAVAVACLTLACALAVPTPAAARRKAAPEPIAVWQLITPDEDRALAEHWLGQIAEGIDAVEGVAHDRDRSFGPDVQPAEGVVVAIDTAARWRDAAWVAHSRREWGTALGLADDALALVEPYPAVRLPEGLRRDLMLLRARALTRLDRVQDARDALRQAMFLDPTWEAHPRWEHRIILDLFAANQAEREGVPKAEIQIVTNIRDAEILVSGVRRADTRRGSVVLDLPAGTYEIAARRAGYATPMETVTLRPRQTVDLDLELDVRNTAAFQEQLTAALADPMSARRSDVWEGLRLASESIAARGVLNARFEREEGTDGGTLQIGLYLPGRAGWAYYGEVELKRDGRDDFRIQPLVEGLAMALDVALHPMVEEVASR